MCFQCVKEQRCVKCGDFIVIRTMIFTEGISDEMLVPEILAQKDVCNDCKLDQIFSADLSQLGYFKTFGAKTAGLSI